MEGPRWVEAATAAQRRLAATVAGLDDDQVGATSLLPGWSVGHVLTHLARSGDGHRQVFEGAALGEVRAQYDSPTARVEGIESGAKRPGREIVADLLASMAALEKAWGALPADRWSAVGEVSGELRTMTEIVFRRVREVEVHHADLGLAYTASEWPDEYVDEELRRGLERLADRADHRTLAAWLLGRAPAPELGPW
jgi:maleylpyruvate isomerase